jgi:methylaspartate mutase sigma subunit
MRPCLRVVVTATASDSHTWNLVFLQLLLEELGHRVLNLGPCVPDDLLVSACVEAEPDLVVVSSVNGHGYQDGLRAIDRLRREPALAAVPVVIGGKLGTAGRDGSRSRELVAAGFDAVFEDGHQIASFRSFVRSLPASVPC